MTTPRGGATRRYLSLLFASRARRATGQRARIPANRPGRSDPALRRNDGRGCTGRCDVDSVFEARRLRITDSGAFADRSVPSHGFHTARRSRNHGTTRNDVNAGIGVSVSSVPSVVSSRILAAREENGRQSTDFTQRGVAATRCVRARQKCGYSWNANNR